MIEEDYNPNESDNSTLNEISGTISIGKNVKIVDKKPDFIVKNNGHIIIGDNCKIDRGVRLLVNNGSVLTIGDNSKIGLNTVINAGCDVSIGPNCLISGMCYIQASAHKIIRRDIPIMKQGFIHGSIKIESDVWICSHVSVLHGVTIEKGSVIGSHSLVNRDVKPYEIVGGVPIKHLKWRNCGDEL